MTYNNTNQQFLISFSHLNLQTTTSYVLSNLFKTYIKSLTYFYYTLACLGIVIYFVNIYSLIIMLNLKSLHSHIKIQYTIQILINLLIGTVFDIFEIFSYFLYQCFYNTLISNQIYYNIFNIDLLNVYTCLSHNFLIPVIEFIWMWNCVNFTLQRCLIIYFPFLIRKIQKFCSWPLNLFQFIFGLCLWWINIYSYKFSVINFYYYYPICNNNAMKLAGSWQYLYDTIATQYITYGIAELLILFSNIILITKIIFAARNRQKLLNLNKAKQNAIENKLTIIIIIGSLFYLILTTPIIFLQSILSWIYFIDSLYVIQNLLIIYYSKIGKAIFILLRLSDFLLIFLLVSQFRFSFCRLFSRSLSKR